MRPKTLKTRFILILISFIVIAVGLPMFFLVAQFRENFHQRSQLMLEMTLDMLENGMDNVMMLGDQKNVQEIVENIAKDSNVNHIRIYDAKGIIRQSSEPNEIGLSVFSVSPDHVPLDFNRRKTREIKILSDHHAYAAFSPILNKEGCRNCHIEKDAIAYLDVDTHLTRAEITFYTGTLHLLFLGIAIIIVLAIGLLYLFNKQINKPVQNVMRALEKVEGGDLSARLPVESQDEFGKLNSHFNNMVSEIESSRLKIEELHNEQLRHVDKLVTIGELTAQMAHEINNYTGIMLSRSDYLLLESKNNYELSKFADDIKSIQTEIEKVANITRNVLRHSKQRKVNFEPIDLTEVVTQSIKIFEPIFRKNNINLLKDFVQVELMVRGDMLMLDQLFTNLISNAIDAINGEGLISLRLYRESGNICAEVSDNGKGIEQADLKNIFSPFFTTKEYDKGTGLGLYIVKNICDLHEAKITCTSTPGVETNFKIVFNHLSL